MIVGWRELVRKGLTPEIPNYRDSYPSLEKRADWWNMGPYEFVIFHPKAAGWILWGGFTMTVLVLCGLIWWGYTVHWLWCIIPAFILYKVLRIGIKYLKMLRLKKTIYQLFLRE